MNTKPSPLTSHTSRQPTVVLGAGPAGLTAAYLLVKQGKPAVVLESQSQVGGLAKTELRDGYRFDLGGHRFFTKSQEVETLWHQIMGEEFLLRPRLSRIYWDGKFLDYPLRAGDVMKKLGPVELTRSLVSYLVATAKPKGLEESFEEWVSNRFGKRLYELFFKSYTEKLWGVPATEIRAEWAAQRIKGLSFFSAAKAAFFGNNGNAVKSLISEFHYPRYGPGQMWEAMAEQIEAYGGKVHLSTPVQRIRTRGTSVIEIVTQDQTFEPKDVVSSLPLRTTVGLCEPAPNEPVVEAARGLRYRDFLTVALVLDGEDLFPDNWIYIHDPGVSVGRIQNYKSWSPWMVPDSSKACVGLEYFCFEDDELWSKTDEALVELASNELEKLGLAPKDKVERGYAVRVPKAYPMYDIEYAARVAEIRGWLEGIENLEQVGRNGLHRYNNSDHSMLTAIRAIENLTEGTCHDLWAVNAESVYHEEQSQDAQQPYKQAPATPAMQRRLTNEDRA